MIQARAVAVNKELNPYAAADGTAPRMLGFTTRMYNIARNVMIPPLISFLKFEPLSEILKKVSILSVKSDIVDEKWFSKLIRVMFK